MKKIFKLTGIIAIVAIIGFSFAACGDGNDDTGGTGNGGETGGKTVPVTGVTLNQSSLSLAKGGSATLVATVTPSNATNKKVSWSTNNAAAATVSNGVVSAVAAGSATIIVTTADGGKTAFCSVDVNDPSLLTLNGIITISPNNGVTVNTQLTAAYSGSETVSFQWKKDGNNIGSVSTANPNKYTPTEAGSYSVTVSATGYNNKTSDPVSVSNGGTGGEDNTNLNSWYVYRDDSSTATVEYSVAADGVCTVNVGGVPEKHGVDGVWNAWKVNAQINYTAKANTSYIYTFEVWTESGARNLQVQYYHDPDENLVLNKNINITSTRTTYTINGQKLPKGGQQRVEFQCANQIGTFYVKMLDIKEYNGNGDWSKWEEPGTTATLAYSVDANGVCTITVGGTANESAPWNVSARYAQYDYTAKANTRYTYTFEAWTESGARNLRFQYCNDAVESTFLSKTITLTNVRQTYTVNGKLLSGNALKLIDFQCANQTGKFYVKMLDIREYNGDADNGDWSVWRDDSSTATLNNYSISNDEVCTVTVGGVPENDDAWKIEAAYEDYTGNAGKCYEYKFEAWTQSGTRNLHVEYYNDNDEEVYLGETISITATRKTYTIIGTALPKSGKQNVRFQLANQLGTVYLKMLNIEHKPIVPTITTDSLPNGTVGTAYNQTLTATGDTPITWSLENGTLPIGFSLAGTGVISGTPTTAGTSTFTVKAANAAGYSTKQLSIIIAGIPPTITTNSLPNGTLKKAYSQTLTAAGNTPITWSLESGTLPIGLNLTGSTISGTPTTAGTSTFTIKAANTAGNDKKQLSITIAVAKLSDVIKNANDGVLDDTAWNALFNGTPFAKCGSPTFEIITEGGVKKLKISNMNETWGQGLDVYNTTSTSGTIAGAGYKVGDKITIKGSSIPEGISINFASSPRAGMDNWSSDTAAFEKTVTFTTDDLEAIRTVNPQTLRLSYNIGKGDNRKGVIVLEEIIVEGIRNAGEWPPSPLDYDYSINNANSYNVAALTPSANEIYLDLGQAVKSNLTPDPNDFYAYVVEGVSASDPGALCATFTVNTQGLFIPFTDTVKTQLQNAADGHTFSVVIEGNADKTASHIRWCFGLDTSSNWNISNMIQDANFANTLTGTLNSFTNYGGIPDMKGMIIQARPKGNNDATAITDPYTITINSIKVTIQ